MNETQWGEFLAGAGVAATPATTWAPMFAQAITPDVMDGPELCAFMGQVLWESGKLTTLSENLNYSSTALVGVFGAHRITQEQASEFGRTSEHPCDQQSVANIVYGGAWGEKNLGNTEPTDGWDFRGSGLIQITGRANFQAAMDDTGVDFIANPVLLRQPGVEAVQAALGFWRRVVKDKWSDATALRRAVNGGLNGLDQAIAETATVTASYTTATA